MKKKEEEMKEEKKENFPIILTSNLPFIVQQTETADNKIRIQNIHQYYCSDFGFSSNIFVKVVQVEAKRYYLFKQPRVIPLSQIIFQLEKQQPLQKIQEDILYKIIQEIIHETNELYTKRQLMHNNITEENILIGSQLDHIYTWNKLVSFKVKLINFKDNIDTDNMKTYNQDIDSLKIILKNLFTLIKVDFEFDAFSSHIELQNQFKMETNAKIRKLSLFQRTCTKEQEDRMNQEFSQCSNRFIKLPINLLHSIFLQLLYKQNFHMERFNVLLERFIKIEHHILKLQIEVSQFFFDSINQVINTIEQNFKFPKLKEETLKNVQSLEFLFGQNLFEEYVKNSSFNINEWSLDSLIEQTNKIYQDSQIIIKENIQDVFQHLLQIEILTLIKELI